MSTDTRATRSMYHLKYLSNRVKLLLLRFLIWFESGMRPSRPLANGGEAFVVRKKLPRALQRWKMAFDFAVFLVKNIAEMFPQNRYFYVLWFLSYVSSYLNGPPLRNRIGYIPYTIQPWVFCRRRDLFCGINTSYFFATRIPNTIMSLTDVCIKFSL